MRLLLVTDAWAPQVNGVVRTLQTVVRELEQMGHEVLVIHPGLFRTVPCPTYPEIRLALFPGRELARSAGAFHPEAVHVATEGSLGLAARRMCVARAWPFTTSFHTRFPEYIEARARIPASWTYRGLRWFHGAARRVMVATESVERELVERGFANTVRWTRGVDTELFRPSSRTSLNGVARIAGQDLPRPIHMAVGRVAVEKNLSAFLELDLPGTQVVVGDGPQRADLERRFPRARFLGAKHGEELAACYAAADVFVFPSRTDTFGLVMLEALASGVPVAAFPVPGPLDVIGGTQVGVLDEDLGHACRTALAIPREGCREFALGFSWRRCAEVFLRHLAPVRAV